MTDFEKNFENPKIPFQHYGVSLMEIMLKRKF